MATATPRKWTDSERTLLEEVAERAWGTIERTRTEAKQGCVEAENGGATP